MLTAYESYETLDPSLVTANRCLSCLDAEAR